MVSAHWVQDLRFDHCGFADNLRSDDMLNVVHGTVVDRSQQLPARQRRRPGPRLRARPDRALSRRRRAQRRRRSDGVLARDRARRHHPLRGQGHFDRRGQRAAPARRPHRGRRDRNRGQGPLGARDPGQPDRRQPDRPAPVRQELALRRGRLGHPGQLRDRGQRHTAGLAGRLAPHPARERRPHTLESGRTTAPARTALAAPSPPWSGNAWTGISGRWTTAGRPRAASRACSSETAA